MSAESRSHGPGVKTIARTGILIALLVVLQWSTSGTQAFAGQYITGSCVNCVLAVAALAAGSLWGSALVALLSPFCAFLLGIGPQLIQIVPCIAVGNLVFVLLLYRLIGGKKTAVWQQALGLASAAVCKFLTLYLLVNRLVVPMMGSALKPQQVATFSAMFSWPQLVTALIGGAVALAILPVIRKAIKK